MREIIINPKRFPEYQSWRNMRNRCLNPRGQDWEHYGGRGITVCPEWDSFWVFLYDMGERPAGYTIDRIDNDGNYTPENCKWASRLEQANNQRLRKNSRMITCNGTTMTQEQWASRLKCRASSISNRLKRMSPEEALSYWM